MIYSLEDKTQIINAKIYFEKLLSGGATVEIKNVRSKRSSLQNRALHKYFSLIADALNELGLTHHYTGITGKLFEVRFTPIIVKEFIWKPLQFHLFDKKTTTKLTTIQINEIIDVLTLYLGNKGVNVPFPNKDYV